MGRARRAKGRRPKDESAIGVDRTRGGWRVQLGDGGAVDVTSPHVDRGQVRGTITVRIGNAIKLRDTVNLTSGRSRTGLIAKLAKKGIVLEERILVALDEACRTPAPVRETGVCDGGGDLSDEVPPCTLSEVAAVFARWLLIHDADYLPVFLGAILAHRFGGDPVWLLIVAPPGGTKTEPLRSLRGIPGFYPLSELTPKTFASGLEVPGGNDPSLLNRLTDEILIFKDFTTVLAMRADDRQAILAQLREIYDGTYNKTFGTGRELDWQGRLGFIAGVTPVIDKHHGAIAALGERFVLFRLIMGDRKNLAKKALAGRGHEAEMRADLNRAMRGFPAGRSSTAPTVPPAMLERLAEVADFVTRARSGVQRDGVKRELEYAPEPEAPTRFAKVLHALATGIACAYDAPVVTERELRLVLRVALDSLPVIRRKAIEALIAGTLAEDYGDAEDEADRAEKSPGAATLGQLATRAHCSTAALRRALEDLEALEVVNCRHGGQGRANIWALAEQWVPVFTELQADAENDNTRNEQDPDGLSSETPPPRSDHNGRPGREPGEDDVEPTGWGET